MMTHFVLYVKLDIFMLVKKINKANNSNAISIHSSRQLRTNHYTCGVRAFSIDAIMH